MTDKELEEWEEEAKEADESIKNILFYGTIALVYILMLYAMIKL